MQDFQTNQAGGHARYARAYASRRYAILFYSLLITIAAGPLLEVIGLHGELLEVLLAANLLAAVMPVTPGVERRVLFTALIAVCALRLVALWIHTPLVSTVGLIIWTVIALVAAAGAIRFAIRASSVDREHLYAALDAYLLFGLFLGVLYWTLERNWPTSIVVIGETAPAQLSLASSIYFSFVTLVTLGYGDIVPHSNAARGLAIVESVTGQLYLTVMIAYLVSLHVLSAANRRANDFAASETHRASRH